MSHQRFIWVRIGPTETEVLQSGRTFQESDISESKIEQYASNLGEIWRIYG